MCIRDSVERVHRHDQIATGRQAQDRRVVADAEQDILAQGDATAQAGDEVEFGRRRGHAMDGETDESREARMVTQPYRPTASMPAGLAACGLSGTMATPAAPAAARGETG